jgi:glycerophosphoryl diester phosphodiesterase
MQPGSCVPILGATRDFAVIAHRGGGKQSPENTLTAFRKAKVCGFSRFELDLHRTKDGVLVVHHDFDLADTAGDPRTIAELAFDEVRRVNVARKYWRTHAPEPIPRIEEVLDLLAPGDELYVEVKNEGNPYPGIEKKLVDLLRSRGKEGPAIVVSSFEHRFLAEIRRLDPDLRLSVLAGDGDFDEAVEMATRVRAESMSLRRNRPFPVSLFKPGQASREQLDTVHAAGMRAIVYTVNSRREADALRRRGADGIFTDDLDLARGF